MHIRFKRCADEISSIAQADVMKQNIGERYISDRQTLVIEIWRRTEGKGYQAVTACSSGSFRLFALGRNPGMLA